MKWRNRGSHAAYSLFAFIYAQQDLLGFLEEDLVDLLLLLAQVDDMRRYDPLGEMKLVLHLLLGSPQDKSGHHRVESTHTNRACHQNIIKHNSCCAISLSSGTTQ